MTTGWGSGARFCRLAALVPVQTTLMVGAGLAVTSAGTHTRLESLELRAMREAVAYRGDRLDVVSQWLSALARTETVVGVTLASLVALLLLSGGRWWREAGFLGAAVALQSAVFLAVTAWVQRPRPGVAPLDTAPPTSSFPSGHVGASVALYGGWVVLALARARGPWRYASTVLLLVPAAVGVSRIHRGMHYPTDVLGGLLNGTLTLLLVGWVVLSARSPAEDRPGRPRPSEAVLGTALGEEAGGPGGLRAGPDPARRRGRWIGDVRGTLAPRADVDVTRSSAARKGR
ncbi:phosphatase PAP2 family protein [Streptomyces sp. NPDC012508]|uniref:phosphatase PAP2 family protein n=1 Tax=Streptomyces sp. NPDC012508 TaxID=3364837 RepID=UPI0036A872E9